MMMCSRCKKNVAVVFVTKIENSVTSNEGLCLPCAQDLGIDLSKSMQAMGLNTEDMDNLEDQVTEMLGISPDIENSELDDEKDDPLKSFFKMMGSDKSEEGKTTVGEKDKKKDKPKKKSLLESYGQDLTKKAAEGNLDAVIGREAEITRCIEILNRRTKNNPCLIGEPGVGKTAIAEGLATRIVAGTVPEKLLDKRVYLLDFTSIVAGTQFRGQFEARLKNILDEVKKTGNIILVIDELHNIVGAGDAEGAMSAANILKPSLARGEIQVIGATTTTEYRKYIEKDAALERRFQPIIVEEPTIEETVEIIKGIRGYYESYHKVMISDDVIRAAADLSERYITDRFLPDKAIDVIDEAASRVNLNNVSLSKAIRLRRELSNINDRIEQSSEAVTEEDFRTLADLRTNQCKIECELAKLEEKQKDIRLTVEDVACVIERWTKIPAKSMTMDENKRLLELEDTLKRRVKGQDEAIAVVASAIRRSRIGLSKKRRPVSFIFTGPTGVGKTELVLALSEAVFDSEEALIRLDMSEYMEKHTVSKIIGSPPGYVGYDDAGQLTEKIRRKPYSIILLDEIEKAHADVLNILLQILEDGRITDSHGKFIDFRNTMVIMTSNAGSDYKGNAPGYTVNDEDASVEKVKTALKEIFRPEFINRIDAVITFKSLSNDILMEILKKLLSELEGMLADRKIQFEITDSAMTMLLNKAIVPKQGARPLRRAIQRELEDKIAHMIISGKALEKGKITVTCDEENLILS